MKESLKKETRSDRICNIGCGIFILGLIILCVSYADNAFFFVRDFPLVVFHEMSYAWTWFLLDASWAERGGILAGTGFLVAFLTIVVTEGL